MWLVVIFFTLAAMNGAASLIAPFFGSRAPLCRAALFIAFFWDAMLLCSIWMRHIWARFALAIFLFGFDAVLLVFVPELLVRHPALEGAGLAVIGLLAVTNGLIAVFLLTSIDIRWLSRPTDAGND
ncbi:MAG: hypothetical protein WCO68_00595 [Verrucomicrobiota bacterium]